LLVFHLLRERFKDRRPFNLKRITQYLTRSLTQKREEGEIRSESTYGFEKDLADVDADPKDLMAAMSSKSYPPSFVFGESKVTTNLIREYEAAGFFPAGDGRAPLDEQTPTLREKLVLVTGVDRLW
jgi:hypothetical protein